jgi:hypothetical protein
MRPSTCALVGWLLLAAGRPSSVAAESAAMGESLVVLVMESGGGVRAGNELRAVLNSESQIRVLSAAEATRSHAKPAAVLTVASDATRMVSVMYWDSAGNTDGLSAPAPSGLGQIDVVARALASALLDRHRAELKAETLESAPRVVDSMRQSKAFYAMLGRMSRMSSRTNVRLMLEDF